MVQGIQQDPGALVVPNISQKERKKYIVIIANNGISSVMGTGHLNENPVDSAFTPCFATITHICSLTPFPYQGCISTSSCINDYSILHGAMEIPGLGGHIFPKGVNISRTRAALLAFRKLSLSLASYSLFDLLQLLPDLYSCPLSL